MKDRTMNNVHYCNSHVNTALRLRKPSGFIPSNWIEWGGTLSAFSLEILESPQLPKRLMKTNHIHGDAFSKLITEQSIHLLSLQSNKWSI
jgi:hypothetical protein